MLKSELNINIDLDNLTINYKRNNIVSGIYKIKSPTGKIYIGQAIDIENRLAAHYKVLKCKTQPLLYHSLKKYGVKNHTFEIIHIVENDKLITEEIKKELNILEIHYIKEFNSFYDNNKELGMNLTKGGNSGCTSEEVKSKISKTLTGRKASEQARENQKNTIKKNGGAWNKGKCGEEHNIYGTKQTPKHIAKRVAKNIGRKQSDESIQKRRETRKRNFEEKIKNGYMPRSEIRKRKREEKLKEGYIAPKKIISKETRKKQSEAKLGKKLSPESIIKRETTRKKNREEKLANGWMPEKRIVSDETRKKQSEIMMGKNKGRKHSEVQNKNHSNIMSGRKQSPETVSKRAETRMLNKKLIEQERRIMIF